MQRAGLLIFILTMLMPLSSQREQPASLEPDIDALVDNLLAKYKVPSIAVGVVKDGKVVLARGFGYADVESKTLANEHTVYQIGSVSKMLTGHLLAKLANEGKVSISDTLASFFPASINFPSAPGSKVVSLKDIATHSSGFPRYPENLQRIDPYPIKGYSKQEMLKGIEMVTIEEETGKTYSYSNFGYGVLGIAMENHMSTPLSTLFDDYIFSDYDMKSSSLVYKQTFKEKLATPYLSVSPLTRTEPWDMGTLSAAGNVFSSVSDLNNFMINLMKDNSVNQTQQTEYLKINDNWSYGLGCFIVQSSKWNTEAIYHGGDIDGYAASLTMYPEHSLGIVLLTNWGEGQAIEEVFSGISQVIEDYYMDSSKK